MKRVGSAADSHLKRIEEMVDSVVVVGGDAEVADEMRVQDFWASGQKRTDSNPTPRFATVVSANWNEDFEMAILTSLMAPLPMSRHQENYDC